VKVHYDEGVAIHIDPESCAGSREAVREVLTGEHAGQPSSRERLDISGADALQLCGRQYEWSRYRKWLFDPARSKTLACIDASCTGTGRPRDWPAWLCHAGPHREGEEP
jgi:hypothetical protein